MRPVNFESWPKLKEDMKKIYYQTWFICLLFAAWPLIIPAIAGIILLVKHYTTFYPFYKKYYEVEEERNWQEIEIQKIHDNAKIKEDDLTRHIGLLNYNIANKNREIKNLEQEKKNLEGQIEKLEGEIELLEKEALCKQYSFSDYSGLTSEECKNKLAVLKGKEQAAIKNGDLVSIIKSGTKREENDNAKQILRCFNTECDNALLNLSVKNIDSTRNKISKSFESLNKIFAVDGVRLEDELLEYKLEELNLVYTYELKKEQERERQKAIKEQMIEEEKVRREIERQKAKIEKDQTQCSNEINKLMSYMQKSQSDVEKQLYIDKIKELEAKLKILEADKETVLEREANARAGYVYVISNVGSFGEDVYKIGMTRRLEPMDRVKELSSASVPFEFDVHAMIFSDDAPALETALHQAFEKQSVNRVNLRKEFFRVSLDEIESVVKQNYNNTVTFTRIPVAKEYNETLQILKQEESA